MIKLLYIAAICAGAITGTILFYLRRSNGWTNKQIREWKERQENVDKH